MATFKRVLNRTVFDEKVQRINVDKRPKSIEMYAFSNEDALLWTRPKPISCIVTSHFTRGQMAVAYGETTFCV